MATDTHREPTHRLRWIVTHPCGRGGLILRDELVVLEPTETGELVVSWPDGFGGALAIPRGDILALDAIEANV